MDKLPYYKLLFGSCMLAIYIHTVTGATDLDQRWVSVCKGDIVSLSCNDGEVVIVTSARYGGFPDSLNPCLQTLDCQEETSVIDGVQKLCYKKRSCSFVADKNSIFDICPSSKFLHLKISYVCAAESSFYDLCTKLDPKIQSGFLVSPNYPESAQKINTTKNCNVTLSMQSRHHVIKFTPIDVRLSPGYLLRKCGMVLYINLRQNKNLEKICSPVDREVLYHGGDATHVFTTVYDQERGDMFALVHFHNNAMMAFELCRRKTINGIEGIIVSPSAVDINEGCFMDIQRFPNEEIVLKFTRKDVSEYVSVTKCAHELIIANSYQYNEKLTADCVPFQASTTFVFKEHAKITFAATSTDKIELMYTLNAVNSPGTDLGNEILPAKNAEPKKDWIIILIVCFVVFAIVVITLLVVFFVRRSKKGKSSQDRTHPVSYKPPVWADKRDKKEKRKSSTEKDGFSTVKSRDSSMVLPESQDRVWRENPTCSAKDIAEVKV